MAVSHKLNVSNVTFGLKKRELNKPYTVGTQHLLLNVHSPEFKRDVNY